VLKNDNGNMAIVFALLLPVLLGFAGAGVDYARYRSVLSEIQAIADTAALAGAREYVIKSDTLEIPLAVAKSIADAGLVKAQMESIAQAVVTDDTGEATVTVAITATLQPGFLVALYKESLHVTASATAQAVGGANICAIGLNSSIPGTVKLQHNARLSGVDCAVYSNSTDPRGLSSIDDAVIDTVLNCSAGGYGGASRQNFNPAPLTDCPPRNDPLSARPAPDTPVSCEYSQTLINDAVTALSPGVYCGGLIIDGASDVTLAPGIYVIRDGDLEIKGSSWVQGEGVGFYFEGADSKMNIAPDTTISLSAPVSGEMAGLLMFQDRNAIPDQKFTISSNNAETLVGTIYLPNGWFYVDAASPVANASAYTAIIANKIELASSVNLVLNSDYQATNVPAPVGIANAGGSVRLRE